MTGRWSEASRYSAEQNEKTKRNGMNSDIINFITYCVGNLSRKLNMKPGEIYALLKKSGILTGYIIPSYDVLHTFGKEYLMEDLTEYMKEKGVLA